ncbi:hypothetical protein [Rhabdothermincola salaria]|uniref:hypothetical protein n=1 Tax=Rhabdothermincola salaria TaxID=2903142 RepID=UPI001E4996E3|nr:hypothetical protein [Rhabdothermincola salaria]MCD9622941.1 hypothetical protein [Rhabdothermincola salaria]
MLVAVGVSLVGLALAASLVYDDFHPTVDHVVYEAQARALLDGSLTLPSDDPGGPLVFTATRGDGLVPKYLPGTAVLGAASHAVVGTFGLASVAAIVLLVVAVGGVARRVGLGPWGAALAGAAAGLSPMVLALDTRLLSYVPGVALGATSLWVVLAAVDQERLRLLVVAGAVLGATLFFRQLEAVAWGLVIVGWLAVTSRSRRWHGGGPRSTDEPFGQAHPGAGHIDDAALPTAPGRQRREPWDAALAFAAGAAPAIVAVVVTTWVLTGSPLRPPFVFVSPDDGPGFGLRRALDTDPFMGFDLLGGLWAAVVGAGLLLPWTAVGSALAVGAAVAVWRFGSNPAVVLLVALGAVVPLAYAVQWSHKNALRGGHYDAVGPFYLLWVVPPLAVLGLLGLRAVRPRLLVGALVVGALAVQATVLWAPVSRQLQLADAWAAFDAELSATEKPALVLLESRHRGKPFDDVASDSGSVVAVPAEDPGPIFDAVERWPGRHTFVALTELESVEGRDVSVPQLHEVAVSAWATAHEGRVAVGCAGAPRGAAAEVVLRPTGDIANPPTGATTVPCGSVVALSVRADEVVLVVEGEPRGRVELAEGATSVSLCAGDPTSPARRAACRRVAVQREGDRTRWVLPGRLDADAGIRGVRDLVGAIEATTTSRR